MLLSVLFWKSLCQYVKQRGRVLQTHGLSWNAWKYLVPCLWGRETFLCEQLFLSWPLLCQFRHCFFILLLYSFCLILKVLEKILCTSCTLRLIWSRTIKLLKDLLILLNNFKNYIENCNSRMMINGTEFLLVTELWNTLLMENVEVIAYIYKNYKSSEIFTIYIES